MQIFSGRDVLQYLGLILTLYAEALGLQGAYLAEIFKGVGDISKMKYVTFEVCNENYISQK